MNPVGVRQDFEDWDDVGLNMAQPASLLQLYRDSASQQAAATTATTADVACHVCFETPVDDARLEQLERAERTAVGRNAQCRAASSENHKAAILISSTVVLALTYVSTGDGNPYSLTLFQACQLSPLFYVSLTK